MTGPRFEESPRPSLQKQPQSVTTRKALLAAREVEDRLRAVHLHREQSLEDSMLLLEAAETIAGLLIESSAVRHARDVDAVRQVFLGAEARHVEERLRIAHSNEHRPQRLVGVGLILEAAETIADLLKERVYTEAFAPVKRLRPADGATASDDTKLTLPRDVVRKVFLDAGFTIKEGHSDLKEYVYTAAYALLERARLEGGATAEDDKKLGLQDFLPLIRKARSHKQMVALVNALDDCYNDDRSIMAPDDWVELCHACIEQKAALTPKPE